MFSQKREIPKIRFIGVDYRREFPDLEEVLKRVKPGMRVGLSVSEKMLELFEQGRNQKLLRHFPSIESYCFIEQLVKGIKKKGAEPVGLVDEELVKKHKMELQKLDKELNRKKERIEFDMLYGGGSSKSPQERLNELGKIMKKEVDLKLSIDSMSILKNAVKEKVHVAILEKQHSRQIRDATLKKAPLTFEFL